MRRSSMACLSIHSLACCGTEENGPIDKLRYEVISSREECLRYISQNDWVDLRRIKGGFLIT